MEQCEHLRDSRDAHFFLCSCGSESRARSESTNCSASGPSTNARSSTLCSTSSTFTPSSRLIFWSLCRLSGDTSCSCSSFCSSCSTLIKLTSDMIVSATSLSSTPENFSCSRMSSMFFSSFITPSCITAETATWNMAFAISTSISLARPGGMSRNARRVRKESMSSIRRCSLDRLKTVYLRYSCSLLGSSSEVPLYFSVVGALKTRWPSSPSLASIAASTLRLARAVKSSEWMFCATRSTTADTWELPKCSKIFLASALLEQVLLTASLSTRTFSPSSAATMAFSTSLLGFKRNVDEEESASELFRRLRSFDLRCEGSRIFRAHFAAISKSFFESLLASANVVPAAPTPAVATAPAVTSLGLILLFVAPTASSAKAGRETHTSTAATAASRPESRLERPSGSFGEELPPQHTTNATIAFRAASVCLLRTTMS
mmetsp:Transcript_9407/g.28358  ORF Transcript_9407/g.28358 Transcript_9407/m.28358 type:complete len:432 (+) Transcript_9407:1667-2962(+)